MTCVCVRVCVFGYYSDTTQWETTKSASRSRSYAPHSRRRRRVSAGASDPWGARSKPVRGVHRGIRGRRRRVRLFRGANRIGEYNARAFSILIGIVCSPTLLPASSARSSMRGIICIYIYCVYSINWILLILAGAYNIRSDLVIGGGRGVIIMIINVFTLQ